MGYHNDFIMYGIAINIELLKIWNIVVPNKYFRNVEVSRNLVPKMSKFEKFQMSIVKNIWTKMSYILQKL